MDLLSDEQADELSLFDAMKKAEDEFKWDINELGEANGQLMVNVDLPQTPVVVSTNIMSPAAAAKDQCTGVEKNRHESVEIMHLPPIRLHFHMTKAYPEKAPPSYSLCCSWLNFSQVSSAV